MDAAAGRSKIATKFGIVAASQPLAARAGVQVLERGGNAIDAAIAANAVMGLVEPHMNGIGGDLFAIVYEAKTGKLHRPERRRVGAEGADARVARDRGPGRDAGERHPLGDRARRRRRVGRAAHAVRHAADGRSPRPGDLLRGERISGVGRDRRDVGWAAPTSWQASRTPRETYLPNGRAPHAGEVFRNPDLAASLRLIAREGPAAFYEGQIADAILALSARAGRHDDGRRSQRVRARMGRADLHDLSRLDGLRAAAEHAGHRGADDAQPDGAVSAGRVRLPQRRGAARDDRGEEAGLRRHAAVRRRSTLRDDAGSRDARQGAREATRAGSSIRRGRRAASSRRCSTA